jgi:hypothetical protein
LASHRPYSRASMTVIAITAITNASRTQSPSMSPTPSPFGHTWPRRGEGGLVRPGPAAAATMFLPRLALARARSSPLIQFRLYWPVPTATLRCATRHQIMGVGRILCLKRLRREQEPRSAYAFTSERGQADCAVVAFRRRRTLATESLGAAPCATARTTLLFGHGDARN